jgi:hypothetical protein
MLVSKRAVKQFVNSNGKQISADGVFELECRVNNILRNAMRLAPGKMRVTRTEIQYARG